VVAGVLGGLSQASETQSEQNVESEGNQQVVDEDEQIGTTGVQSITEGNFHAPGDVPDDHVVVRGGQSDMPASGTISGAQGASLEEAGRGVQHGSLRETTAGE